MNIIDTIIRAVNKGYAIEISSYRNGFKSIVLNEKGFTVGCVFISEYRFGTEINTIRLLEHNGIKTTVTTSRIKNY